jgi:probable addiction module antidote protein
MEAPKARTVTAPYDPADHLKTGKQMAALLDAALEDGDPRVIAAALGAIARAQGMTQLAKGTGLRREALYRALSSEGNPELATLIKVVKALGLQLHASVSS